MGEHPQHWVEGEEVDAVELAIVESATHSCVLESLAKIENCYSTLCADLFLRKRMDTMGFEPMTSGRSER